MLRELKKFEDFAPDWINKLLSDLENRRSVKVFGPLGDMFKSQGIQEAMIVIRSAYMKEYNRTHKKTKFPTSYTPRQRKLK